MRKKIIYSILVSLVSIPICAQDTLQSKTLREVVITGTRYGIPAEKSGKTITKISGKNLEQQSGRSVADVLNSVPNVQIDGLYGTPGTNLGYYVRGARNRQSVILIDGVPMIDPSGISPEFDLRLLALDQISSLEVMRGGLSTLYGSGAAASVINISLKEPSASGIHGTVDLNGGSFGTFSQNLSISGRSNKFYFQALGNNMRADGFSSAASKNSTQPFDRDGYERQNGLLKAGFVLKPNIDVQVFGGLDQFTADYDGGPYIDADNQQEYKQWRAGIKTMIDHNKGNFQLIAQRTKLDKEFKSLYPAEYTGYTTFIEALDKVQLTSFFSLVGGLSYQHQSYAQPNVAERDTTKFTIADPYAAVVFDFPGGFNFQAGGRLNNHSEYGSNFIYNINPSYLIKISEAVKIKMLSSLSTSYITPSLYQLFSFYGNKKLKPEEALNLEGGAALYLKNFSVHAVFFYRKETDAIGFQSFFDDQGNFMGGQYYNLAEARKVHGVEVEAGLSLTRQITVAANYSYATSDNVVSFYRIPKHKAGLSARAAIGKGGDVSIRYQYTGSRKDIDYSTFTEVALDDFHLIDLSVSQNFFGDRINFYGSINNITDEKYTWAPGYRSMPRNFTLGVKFKF